jgi:hypothetical protein
MLVFLAEVEAQSIFPLCEDTCERYEETLFNGSIVVGRSSDPSAVIAPTAGSKLLRLSPKYIGVMWSGVGSSAGNL